VGGGQWVGLENKHTIKIEYVGWWKLVGNSGWAVLLVRGLEELKVE